MKTIAFHTLGCKVNQYETQAMRELFLNSGYTETAFDSAADVYLINTCTVTGLSDRKSRQMIRRARRLSPDAIIAVTGCYAQVSPNEVAALGGVNIVIGTDKRAQIVELVQNACCADSIVEVGDIMHRHTFEELQVSTYTERVRAYIKVQEGCRQFCSYCIIPYARGPVRSRNPEEVLREAERLAQAGFCEIVLVGIHIASYGKDLDNRTNLAAIIAELHAIPGIRRMRLSSIEPMTLDGAFIEVVKNAGDKLCPHFHISLQSGCDATLARMNRKYNTADYAAIVGGLREVWDDVAITTDIMVGFPGETEDEFAQSLEFARKVGFADIHVFPYSPRKGTPAAVMENQVDPRDKQLRSDAMLSLASESRHAFMRKMVGAECKVLFEQKFGDTAERYIGKTANYIDVVCDGSGQDLVGQLCDVRIAAVEDEYLIGRIV